MEAIMKIMMYNFTGVWSVDINDEHTQELLHELIDKWVHMRGFAMASSWVEDYNYQEQKFTEKTTGS